MALCNVGFASASAIRSGIARMRAGVLPVERQTKLAKGITQGRELRLTASLGSITDNNWANGFPSRLKTTSSHTEHVSFY